MLTRKIQVIGRTLAQVRRDLSPIHLDHFASVEDGDHERPVEVFVAALAIDAELLQPATNCRAAGAVLRLQPIAQSAIREAQTEPLHHLRRLQAAPFEIALRLRRLLQRLLIEAHDGAQQRVVVGVRRDRRGQYTHRADLHRFDPRSG